MKKLLIFDDKNYTNKMPIIERIAVRAIIKKGNYFAMQYSKHGVFKIPGGGVQEGETQQEALFREVLEETGMRVILSSIYAIGEVEEIREDIFYPGKVFHARSFYYFCEVEDEIADLCMSTSEINEGFQLKWATAKEIHENNMKISDMQKWIYRDTKFIQLILEDKIQV